MTESTRPGAKWAAYTASDTVDCPKVDGKYPRAFYLGTGGTAVLVAPDDTSASYANLNAGQVYPLQVRRINATGLTGVANIVVIY
jgi:hypothetical protein